MNPGWIIVAALVVAAAVAILAGCGGSGPSVPVVHVREVVVTRYLPAPASTPAPTVRPSSNAPPPTAPPYRVFMAGPGGLAVGEHPGARALSSQPSPIVFHGLSTRPDGSYAPWAAASRPEAPPSGSATWKGSFFATRTNGDYETRGSVRSGRARLDVDVGRGTARLALASSRRYGTSPVLSEFRGTVEGSRLAGECVSVRCSGGFEGRTFGTAAAGLMSWTDHGRAYVGSWAAGERP